MAKITRKTAKVFGSTAGTNQIAVYGSLAASSPAFSTDPATIQSLGNWLAGWFSGVEGPSSPAIEDMNAFCYVMAYQIAYDLQQGVAEWDSGTTYYAGSLASDGNGNVYVSLTNTNLNNAVTSITNWTILPGNIAGLIYNIGLSCTVASSALTITMTDRGGNAFSSTSAAFLGFRSSTLTSANTSTVGVGSSGPAITIPSTNTMGSQSAVADYIYVWALNNSGTIELGVSGALFEAPTGIASSTAIAASQTSASTLYSASARTNVPVVLLGRLANTQTTAGTWAAVPTVIMMSGNQNQDLNYEEGTFSITFSQGAGVGGSSLGPFAVNFVREGKMVTLTFPNMASLIAGATQVSFGVPSGAVPKRLSPIAVNLGFPVFVEKNDVALDTPGYLVLGTDGSFTLFVTFSGTSNWVSGNTNNGMIPTAITYMVV